MKSFFKLPPEFRNGYKDRKRLAAVAQMRCIVCEQFPEQKPKNAGRLEVHHFTSCGIGKKASDLLTLPLCITHHTKHRDSKKVEELELSVHGLTHKFEKKFGTQAELLKLVNKKLGDEKRYQVYWDFLEMNKN